MPLFGIPALRLMAAGIDRLDEKIHHLVDIHLSGIHHLRVVRAGQRRKLPFGIRLIALGQDVYKRQRLRFAAIYLKG